MVRTCMIHPCRFPVNRRQSLVEGTPNVWFQKISINCLPIYSLTELSGICGGMVNNQSFNQSQRMLPRVGSVTTAHSCPVHFRTARGWQSSISHYLNSCFELHKAYSWFGKDSRICQPQLNA